MPSAAVYHYTVVEVVACFLTRDLYHRVTIVEYSDFRKARNINIVLPEFPHCQCLHTDILEGSDVPVCYVEDVLPA